MYNTSYHRVSSTDEAVAALKSADDGKLIAGGQTLIPTMKQRLAAPSDLVDLRHIDAMQGITIDGDTRIIDGELRRVGETRRAKLNTTLG